MWECACIYTRAYVHIYSCVRAYILVRTCIYTRAYVHIYSCVRAYILVHANIHVRACVRAGACGTRSGIVSAAKTSIGNVCLGCEQPTSWWAIYKRLIFRHRTFLYNMNISLPLPFIHSNH